MDLINIGDLHLTTADGSGGLSKYIPDHNKMVMDEVDKVVAYMDKRGLTNANFAGDLCDGPRMSYEGTMAFASGVKKHPHISFTAQLGNHDLFSEDPKDGHSLELIQLMKIPNLRIFTKPRTIEIDGQPVRFLPFPHESFDPKALNLYHKEVRGSKSDSGRLMDSEDLPITKALVSSGHLHTAHSVRNTHYMGTLYQTNFGESLPKYFHHIEFNGPKDCEVNLIPHDPLYKLHTIVLASKDDLKEIPNGQTDLVKLVVQDGADVSASDYAKFQNIAVVKRFKSKEDLALVLQEDLAEAEAMIIRSDDFFAVWISALDVEPTMRKRIRVVRKRLINTVAQ